MRTRGCLAAAVVAVVVLVTSAVRAAEPVGSVAALEGRAEVLHAGEAAWSVVAAGDAVYPGDQLRTGEDSRLKLLFRDDTVMTVGASSQLTVDEQVAGERPVSRFSLLVGSVRALVTEVYGGEGARFEMETPTAIAGVRGTSFIASYDTTQEETVVVGLVDTTFVRGRVDTRGAREVRLAPGQSTRVGRGRYPLPPTMMPESVLRGLSAATSLRGGAGGAKQGGGEPQARPNAAAEPRVPQARGNRVETQEERVVDQPIDIIAPGGRKFIPPPPPPIR